MGRAPCRGMPRQGARSARASQISRRQVTAPYGQNVRVIAPGRKNFLFVGSDAGGEILADAMTVIETAKLSGINPEAYLADILGRVRAHEPKHLDELLPWTWRAVREATPKAA